MIIENLSLNFSTQQVFENINIKIKENAKVGIIGVNGAGKSTLFRLILKDLEPDSGRIMMPKNTRIGFLPQVIQDEVENMEMTVFSFLLSGRPIEKLEGELQKTYELLSTLTNEKEISSLLKKAGQIEEKLDYYERYEAENILLQIVYGIHLDSLLDLKLCDLSGGQKSKVAFARLLYSKPEILLLDEPTNHLDIDTKDYIVDYLKKYQGMVLVISHDIPFLNEVTNETLYLDKINHQMELYPGPYEKYKKIREEREKTQERILESQEKEEEKLKKIIAKYIRGNEKKANIAKDRQKKLARLQEEKIVIQKKAKFTRFKFTMDHESGLIPIKVEKLSFGYLEDNLILNNINLELIRGEKLLIVGENGVGKSTFLKLLVGNLKPWSGDIIINDKVVMGYYAQEHELLEKEKTILENFLGIGKSVTEIRSLLGNFLFTGDDIYKKISVLSPGERSRVTLAKLTLTNANVLLLDEPTNHLDPETQKIIAETFKSFPGTMLVVSHNPEFVNNLGIERMLVLPTGEVKDYDTNIIEFYHQKDIERLYKK